MIYIYDVLLNFCSEKFEHFEWNKTDAIYNVKKIPVFKTNNEDFEKINSGSKINNIEFLDLIKNKTEISSKKSIKYAFILCNKKKACAVMANEKGIITKISSILLEEEEDILEMYNLFSYVSLNVTGSNSNNFMTREEIKKYKYIKSNLNSIDKERLEYIYYEITGKEDYDYYKFKKIVYDNINSVHKFFLMTQNSE